MWLTLRKARKASWMEVARQAAPEAHRGGLFCCFYVCGNAVMLLDDTPVCLSPFAVVQLASRQARTVVCLAPWCAACCWHWPCRRAGGPLGGPLTGVRTFTPRQHSWAVRTVSPRRSVCAHNSLHLTAAMWTRLGRWVGFARARMQGRGGCFWVHVNCAHSSQHLTAATSTQHSRLVCVAVFLWGCLLHSCFVRLCCRPTCQQLSKSSLVLSAGRNSAAADRAC